MGDIIRCPKCATHHYRNDPCLHDEPRPQTSKFDAYRRGVETGVMKSATPNVVRELLDEIDRLQAEVNRLELWANYD